MSKCYLFTDVLFCDHHSTSRFEAEKKELLQKKLKLSKENDEKKSKLDELEKQLDRFVVVSFLIIFIIHFKFPP
jgi:hypothetical protein